MKLTVLVCRVVYSTFSGNCDVTSFLFYRLYICLLISIPCTFGPQWARLLHEFFHLMYTLIMMFENKLFYIFFNFYLGVISILYKLVFTQTCKSMLVMQIGEIPVFGTLTTIRIFQWFSLVNNRNLQNSNLLCTGWVRIFWTKNRLLSAYNVCADT